MIEDLLAEKEIVVTLESIRLSCNKFGSVYAKMLRRQHQGYGDTFFLDEVFVKIQGEQLYLWRTIEQADEIVDIFLQHSGMAKLPRDSLKNSSRNVEMNPGG